MEVMRPHGSLIMGLYAANVFTMVRNKLAELALQTLDNESPPVKGDVHGACGTPKSGKLYNIA